MKNSLIAQSLDAPNFIREIWPGLLMDAEEAIKPWRDEIKQVYLCGCGDSHHAAIGLEFAFDLWSGRKVRAAPAMFMSHYLVPRLKPMASDTLVIGISVSGEVARTIEAIEFSNEIGAKTLAFTSNPESFMAKRSKAYLSASTPSFPGPGLLSYLSSLLMGYATCAVLADTDDRVKIRSYLEEIPPVLDGWIPSAMERGRTFAEVSGIEAGCLFVAGGSLIGSAFFAAAKIIESAGTYAWAQEIEEWAHIEYFCNPDKMPTWFLSAGGRTRSREQELLLAAKSIGRRMHIDQWEGSPNWNPSAREALAPLGLWAGPTACAVRLAERIGEEPFRNFGGGRSHVEGGGVSRIRSSERPESFRALLD